MSEPIYTLENQPKLDSDITKNRFKGEVVIVTGGAGGIGGEIVNRFVNDGAKVAIFDLNLEAAKKKFAQQENVRLYQINVTDRDLCFSTVAKVTADLGPVRHLVNCVAYFGSESLNSTKADWDKTMSVNVMASAFMVQAVLQVMKEEMGNRSITNISSISAHSTQPNRWTYAASKGAVNILTKDMALDLAKWKIRVNSVSPAWVWSPEVAKAAGEGGREKWDPVWGKYHMFGRMGEMSEVAGAVTFLASKDATFVNATDLKVDGGYGAMSAEGLGESSSFAGCSK